MMLLSGMLQIMKAIFDCDTRCKDLVDQEKSGVYVAKDMQFVSLEAHNLPKVSHHFTTKFWYEIPWRYKKLKHQRCESHYRMWDAERMEMGYFYSYSWGEIDFPLSWDKKPFRGL